jgi:predicted HTH transcriptional regulator
MGKPNPFKEELAAFLEAPSREGLRDVLKAHVGESSQFELKRQWPEDVPLAKHVLALANSGGGCLVVGVEESEDSMPTPIGLDALREKSKIDQALRRFIPETLAATVYVMDAAYQASEYPSLSGKCFQVVVVPDLPEHLPFLAVAETTGLRRNSVFVRRMASTEEANYEELQRVLNRRIETQHSSRPVLELTKHLDELQALSSRLELFHLQHPFGNIISGMTLRKKSVWIDGKMVLVEPYEDFLSRAIVTKQRKIAELLNSSK